MKVRTGFMKKSLLRAVSGAEHLRAWLLDEQPWFQSWLMPALPRRLRWFLRSAYFAPIDLADRALGRDTEMPPKANNFTGDRALRDFGARGEVFIDALTETASLKSSSHVLDVGCGLGRLAVAVSNFLDGSGRYEGLDIVPDAIRWCQQNVRGPHDNANFTLADVYNKEYNPKGKQSAASYRFPWDDDTFDIVALVSVFTHMLPEEFSHYISEITRVLKKGGHIFATYYLINQESLQLMKSNGRGMQFKINRGTHWIQNGRVPELAVAYDEQYVRGVYARHGLSDSLGIYHGNWCGRSGKWPHESPLGDQDTVVAEKLGNEVTSRPDSASSSLT